MMVKKLVLVLLVTLLSLAFMGTGIAIAQKKVELKIGTAAVGSGAYGEGLVLAACIKRRLAGEGISLEAMPAPGSSATLRQLGKGEIDIANSSYLDFMNAWKEAGPFKKDPPKVKPLHGLWKPPNAIGFVALASNKEINTVKDLVGKKVYMYTGGTRFAAKTAIDALGYRFKETAGESMEIADALRMGIVEASVFYDMNGGTSTASWCQNLDAIAEIKWIRYSEQDRQTILSKDVGLGTRYFNPKILREVNQKNFPKDEKDRWAPAVAWGYTPGPHIPEDVYYKMWTTWVKYADEDLVASGALFAIWFQDLVKWVTIGIEANPKIPVHPGLVKWLKEQGAWKSDWKVGKLTK